MTNKKKQHLPWYSSSFPSGGYKVTTAFKKALKVLSSMLFPSNLPHIY